MNLRKIVVLGVILLQVLSSSCAKIDSFGEPHMLEGFTGVVKVTPGIEGVTATTYSPGLIFFNSNKTGTETVMYGPTTENFSIYTILPEGENRDQFRNEMKKKGVSALDKLDFSGFRGRVQADGKTIKIYDFGSQSEGMKLFKWKVQGTGMIDGPDSHVKLTISTTVGILQDLLPGQILEQLGASENNESLKETEDRDAVVYLAQIEVLGESLTFGY